MKISRKLGAAGFVAICAAVVSAVFPVVADAAPRHYTSYRACLTAGNTLAQQGKVHNFACVAEPSKGIGVHPVWDLIIYS